MSLENGNTKSHVWKNDSTRYQRHKADRLLLDTVIICMIYLMNSLILKQNYYYSTNERLHESDDQICICMK